jgi:Uri superfamily endonuclease
LIESKPKTEKSLITLHGIYVLLINMERDVDLTVGAKGRIQFKKGLYAYVGSGQINLEQRIKRHLKKEKRKFWHIDYLLSSCAAKIVKVFFREAEKTEECTVAITIGKKNTPIIGFGCSDCKCRSHLFYTQNFRLKKDYRELEGKSNLKFLHMLSFSPSNHWQDWEIKE